MSTPNILHDVLYYVGVAQTSILLYVFLLAALAVVTMPRMSMPQKTRTIVVDFAPIGIVGAFVVDSQYDSYRRAWLNHSYTASTNPELPMFTTILSGLVLAACVIIWIFFQKSLVTRRGGVRFLSFVGGCTVVLASLSVFAYMVDIQVTRDFAMYSTALDNVLVDIFIYARDFAFILAAVFVLGGFVVAIRAYGRQQFRKGVESVTPRSTLDMSPACEADDPQPFLTKAPRTTLADTEVATVPTSQWSAHAQG